MRLIQLFETGGGTFVSVRLTPTCNERIIAWMAQELIEEPTGGGDLHCTLVLDKNNKIVHDPIVFDPVLKIDPATYRIDLFGSNKNVLVLRFECPELEQRQAELMNQYGLVSEWGAYKPHITLSTKVQEIKTDLEPPHFELEFDKESVEAFSTTYKG
jgi:hypothetical protein